MRRRVFTLVLLIALLVLLVLADDDDGRKKNKKNKWNKNNKKKNRLRRCSLAVKPGPCRAALPRWYFDRSTNKCVHFFYGGCGGNRNRFKTLEKCKKKCKDKFQPCPEPVVSVKLPEWCHYVAYGRRTRPDYCPKYRLCCGPIQQCSHLPDPGPCEGLLQRYYFDRRSNECYGFTYGGCEGNVNRFLTLTACQRTCKDKFPQCPVFRLPAPPPGCDYVFEVNPPNYCPSPRLDCFVKKRCSLKPDAGECRAKLNRYYFDRVTNSCRKFTYGGCNGNENRFTTIEECRNTCGDKFELCPIPGLTRPPDGCEYVEERLPPTYCPTFRLECPPIRQCSLRPDPGPCKAAFGKFYFDRTTETCEKFTYGGCRGNENRFDTLEDCQKTCAGKFPRCPVAGVLPPREGCEIVTEIKPPGFCALPREQCPPFDPEIECRRPPAKGDCGQALERFAYDPRTGSCIDLTFGGCGGNRNNFETREECEKTCQSVINPCLNPNPCPNPGDRCIPEPKNCPITPCKQFRCEPGSRHCPANAEFQNCGSGCGPDNCGSGDPALRICPAVCIEDCFCQEGYVFEDESNQRCIPKESCPEAESCPENAKFQKCGSGCGPDNCNSPDPSVRICPAVCIEGCFCRQGYVFEDASNERCVQKDTCEPECPSNSSFNPCGSACPQTCDSLNDDPPKPCILLCVPGCQCNSGFVLDGNGRCLPPRECPGNRVY